jgi:hypothetical protein
LFSVFETLQGQLKKFPQNMDYRQTEENIEFMYKIQKLEPQNKTGIRSATHTSLMLGHTRGSGVKRQLGYCCVDLQLGPVEVRNH